MSELDPTLEQPEDRPEPVVDAAKLAGMVSALVVAGGGILVLLGLATAEQVQAWAVAIGGVVLAGMTIVAYVAPIWHARKARDHVTPISDPRDDDGVHLVRARFD